MMFPEAFRRVEKTDDDGATDSEVREDSQPDERLGEKYCDSQSGGHKDDFCAVFAMWPDSKGSEVR